MLSLEVEVDLGILGFTEVTVEFCTHIECDLYFIGRMEFEKEYQTVQVLDVKLLGQSVEHLIEEYDMEIIKKSVLDMLEEA